MPRNAPVYFARVGTTTKGRGWYKLSDGKGNTFGRRFTIKGGVVVKGRKKPAAKRVGTRSKPVKNIPGTGYLPCS